jgi:hypothetical protein
MSKIGSYDPSGHLRYKLWSKERPEVELAIWLPTNKSQESTRFPHIQAACHILLEIFRRKIQLCFRPHCNQRSTLEVMHPQSRQSPRCGNSRTGLGSLGTKCHLDVVPMESCKEYYKGEGGDFPQVQAVVNLVSPRLPVVRPSTKSAQIMH